MTNKQKATSYIIKGLISLGIALAGVYYISKIPRDYGEKFKLHAQALKKYAPLTTEQKDSLFKDLNPGLREFIDTVYFINEKDFFDGNEKIGGHVHRLENILCFSKENYTSTTPFHESAHIRHTTLETFNSDFSKRFGEVANLNYWEQINTFLKSREQKIQNGLEAYASKEGLLRPYLATNIYEDVGQFVESLGYDKTSEQVKEEIKEIKLGGVTTKFKNNYIKIESLLFPLYFVDTTDHRYQQKLDLLKKYNFLTKEEHGKLSKELGSLNYLLKQEGK